MAMAAKGVRNQQVAEAADVHVKTVSQWLGGRQTPDSPQMVKLARFLGVSEKWLLEGAGDGPSAARVRELAVREGYDVYTRNTAKRLPPKAYELVYEYTKKLEAAGLDPTEIEEAERFLINGAYNKLNARDPGEKSEEDLILDIKAAWQFVRDVVKRSGRKL